MAEEIENNEEIESQEETQLEDVDNEQEQGVEETEQNEDGGSSTDGDAPKRIVHHASGAPAWMATFADMATLLWLFFVLLLSFAETELPKFKMISGALKNALE